MKRLVLLFCCVWVFTLHAQRREIDSLLQVLRKQKQATNRVRALNTISHHFIALLMVFEIINLYIHSYLANARDHSPLLILLLIVGLAAMLVPVHHRLGKWITHQLEEKNKKHKIGCGKKKHCNTGRAN